MSFIGTSNKDEKSIDKEKSNNVDKSESCKRKRTQISLTEYFSKKKRVKEGEVEIKSMICCIYLDNMPHMCVLLSVENYKLLILPELFSY